MNPFIIRPRIEYYDTLGEFASMEELGEGDLIILEGFIRDRFTKVFPDKATLVDIAQYCKGEPTDIAVTSIRKAIDGVKFSRVIAIGGGTVIDIAKVLSLANGDNLDGLLSKSIVPERSSKLVLIPTTCGTGSEMTNISIIDFTEHNVKMGITGDALYADQAVLIPEMLKGIPTKVFAASSIDALIHASESYVSPKANDFTRIFSTKAIKMILEGYKEYLRGRMVLTDELNCAGALCEWEKILSETLNVSTEDVYDKLEELLDSVIEKKSLSEYGMKEDEIGVFADTVINSQKRLMDNNFVPLDRFVVYEIYESLYK